MSIKMACTELVTRYCIAVNRWDLDAYVSVWALDGVWQRPVGEAMQGRVDIRTFMESLPRDRVLRHVNGCNLVEVIDEDHATGWSQTVVYDTVGSAETPARIELPTMVVEYADEYERRSDEWFIARRDTSWIFVSDTDTISRATPLR
jgi:hypothetical protein